MQEFEMFDLGVLSYFLGMVFIMAKEGALVH